MKRIRAPVLYNEEVMPRVKIIWVDAPEVAEKASPGQFVMVGCGQGYESLLRRPTSVHRIGSAFMKSGSEAAGRWKVPPTAFAMLYNAVGTGYEWLARRTAGDEIDLLGPMGQGYLFSPAYRKILLVGGGVGVAPLAALADEAVARGCSVTLIIGGRNASLIYPKALLPSSVKLVPATDDGSMGKKGFVTDLLSEHLGDVDQIFACGPFVMYKSLAPLCQRLGIGNAVQILMEVRMACGFGVCYGCSVETRRGMKLACKEGPRFHINDILWETL
ncbi:MAG: dihydroorotate dehydrogenase electron transfer subunit [Chloroflexi bacterium]|nr:dihydroorotate dehydrogenase electron transfer subunit [Chloroflexota bacterium]